MIKTGKSKIFNPVLGYCSPLQSDILNERIKILRKRIYRSHENENLNNNVENIIPNECID